MNIVRRQTLLNLTDTCLESLQDLDEVGEETLRSEIANLVEHALRYMPELEENLLNIGLEKSGADQ